MSGPPAILAQGGDSPRLTSAEAGLPGRVTDDPVAFLGAGDPNECVQHSEPQGTRWPASPKASPRGEDVPRTGSNWRAGDSTIRRALRTFQIDREAG